MITRLILYAFVFFVLFLVGAVPVQAKVYIDVVAAPRVLPIAVQDLSGQNGAEISSVIADDLTYTGLFSMPDTATFRERPEEGFVARHWAPLGVEAVVKGFVTTTTKDVVATIILYDVLEDRIAMRKQYRADPRGVRYIGHQAAVDIYEKITGQRAIFTSQLAYITGKGGSKDIHMVDWDGNRPRPMGLAATLIMSPRWSPDGTRLIYSSNRAGVWGIYMLDLTNAKETPIYSTDGICMAGDFFPGGGEFTFSSSKMGTADIYIYNMKDKVITRLTSDIGIEVSPAVSPDGGTITYVSDKGGTPQVYSMDKLGYNVSRLTFAGAYNTSPSWSPKGDLIVYSGRYEGRNQIFLMKPDGSDPIRLTERGNNEDPTFSPDGKFIAFSSDRDGVKGIYMMKSDGTGQRRINPAGETAVSPRWSAK